MDNLRSKIRKLGYELAVREIYGENTAQYFKLKRDHNGLLARLYELEKRS